MRNSTPSELETWLLSLLQSTRNHAEEKNIKFNNHRSSSSSDPIVYFDYFDKDDDDDDDDDDAEDDDDDFSISFSIDSIAYLRVLEAYGRSKSADSPQKAEYWIGILERHYGAARDLYEERYGVHDDGGSGGSGGGSGGHATAAPAAADDDDDDTTRQSPSGFASLKARSLEKTIFDATTTTPPSSKSNRHPQLRRSSSEKPEKRTSSNFNDIQRERAAAIVRNLHPTVECYNAIIESWGHDSSPISVVRSRRWLTKLEDEAKKNTHHQRHQQQYSTTTSPKLELRKPLKPNAKSYDLYLHSCSRGLGKQTKLHAERAEEAQRLLDYRLASTTDTAILPSSSSSSSHRDIRPTTESFNYVLRAWTRCRKDASVARRVMELVLRMERIQKEFSLESSSSSSSSSAAAAAADDAEENSWKGKVAPDTKTYSMAIDGWIIKAGAKADAWRSKKLSAMNKAKQLRASDGGRRRSGMIRNTTTTGEEGDFSEPRIISEHVGKDDGTKEMEKAETILK